MVVVSVMRSHLCSVLRWSFLGALLVACPAQPDRARTEPAPKPIELTTVQTKLTRMSNHISGRVKLQRRSFPLRLQGLDTADAKAARSGFCAALATSEIRCADASSGDSGALDISFALAPKGGGTIEVSGTLRLNEGSEEVRLMQKLRVASGGTDLTALGTQVGKRWLEALRAELAQLKRRARPSAAVRWVASPGLDLKPMWPLRFFSVLLGENEAWTVQKGIKGGAAAFHLSGEGRASSAISLDGLAPGLNEGAFVAEADQRALFLGYKDKVAHLSALSAAGVRRLAEFKRAYPLGGPAVDAKGRVYVPLHREKWIEIHRLNKELKVDATWRLPESGGAVESVQLVWLSDTRLGVWPFGQTKRVYTIDTTRARARPKILWRWRASPPSQVLPRVVGDGSGGAMLLETDNKLVALDSKGRTRWSKELEKEGGFNRIVRAGELVVLMGRKMLALSVKDGRPRFQKKLQARAALLSRENRLVVCADKGLEAWNLEGESVGGIRLSGACDQLRQQRDGGFLVGDGLAVLRIGPVERW